MLRSIKVQYGLLVSFYIDRNGEVEHTGNHYVKNMQPFVLSNKNRDAERGR